MSENIELIKTEKVTTIAFPTTRTNLFGHVDTFQVLSNAKVLEIQKETHIQKVTLTWFLYKSKQDYLDGKQPTEYAVETIEFPKEHLFQLIQTFYQLQAGI